METDQQHFARTAKQCPHCHRQPLIHDGGCSVMVCGRDTHGTQFLGGCLNGFNWGAAPAYTAPPDEVYVPAIAGLEAILTQASDRAHVGGQTCRGCNASPIKGAFRIECLCCPAEIKRCDDIEVAVPIAFCGKCAKDKRIAEVHFAWHTFVVRAPDAEPMLTTRHLQYH